MRNPDKATQRSFEARSGERGSAPSQPALAPSLAWFDWGMGLGAALDRGHGRDAAAPRSLDHDPKGRPPSS